MPSRIDRTTNARPPTTPVERPSSLSLGMLFGALLAGMGVTVFLVVMTWMQVRDLQITLDERFSGMENRLAQLSTKVDQVSVRAAAPPKRSGAWPFFASVPLIANVGALHAAWESSRAQSRRPSHRGSGADNPVRRPVARAGRCGRRD